MKKTLTIVLVLLSLLGIATDTNATPATPPFPVEVIMTPTTPLTLDGPVTFEIKVSPRLNHFYDICGDITVTFETKGKLQYSGPENWALLFEDADTSTQHFDMTFFPNDTCAIVVVFKCSNFDGSLWRENNFVTTTNSIVQWGTRVPTPAEPVQADPHAKPKRDTMTVEQLAVKHFIGINLSDPNDRQFAENLLGPIPDSAKAPSKREGFFQLDVSLDHMFQLHEFGIDFDYARDQAIQQSKTPPEYPKGVISQMDPAQLAEDRRNDLSLRSGGYEGMNTLEDMRELEKTPYMTGERQQIIIEGKLYWRDYGESKFHHPVQLKPGEVDTTNYGSPFDRALDTAEFDVCLIFRKSENIAYARTLIDTWEPHESDTAFDCRTTKANLRLLMMRSVSVCFACRHDYYKAIDPRDPHFVPSAESSGKQK